MSYETTSETRARKLKDLFTDTSDIIESNSNECIEYFNKLVLNDLHENTKNLNCWIAGGSIRDYFVYGKVINDIDIYFPNSFEFKKAEGYFKWEVNYTNPKNITGWTSKDSIFENHNCIKYKYSPKISSDLEIMINPNLDIPETTVDLIKIHSTSPEICISNFDFTICAASVSKDKFYHHRYFFDDLHSKNLKSINPNPESLIYRIQKLSKMGFSLKKEEIIKLTQKFIKIDA